MKVNRLVAAGVALVCLAIAGAAQAGSLRPHDVQSCLVEVLYSEELPIGPEFHHTVKATLLVTPADRPPFETTVVKAIPWQAPPPRQGQRLRMACDRALIGSTYWPF